MLGEKLGRLTVKKLFGQKVSGRHPKYLCACECGEEVIRSAATLKTSREPSCGCSAKDYRTKMHNLASKKFGMLTVLQRSNRKISNGKIYWDCICECGKQKSILSSSLTTGKTKSCGCSKNNRNKNILVNGPEYVSWYSMKTRVNNKKSKNYKYYGGRGIKYCNRWETFENFYFDMGKRPPNTTLDRINVNGNYEPENCRWADNKTQQNNKRQDYEKMV